MKGVSKLQLDLSQLTLVDGQLLPVQTTLLNASAGTSNGRDAAAIGLTTGDGAAIGAAAAGGPGAAIGAGAGFVASVRGRFAHARQTDDHPSGRCSHFPLGNSGDDLDGARQRGVRPGDAAGLRAVAAASDSSAPGASISAAVRLLRVSVSVLRVLSVSGVTAFITDAVGLVRSASGHSQLSTFGNRRIFSNGDSATTSPHFCYPATLRFACSSAEPRFSLRCSREIAPFQNDFHQTVIKLRARPAHAAQVVTLQR